MYQKRSEVLALTLACPTTVAVGDVVVIGSDLTVAAISAAGHTSILGTVVQHLDDAATCTVETRFRERRDDRVSGAAIPVGPFVWDSAGKAIAYNAATHDSAAIAGLCIKSANAGNAAIETVEY